MIAFGGFCCRRSVATVFVLLGLMAPSSAFPESLKIGGTGAGLGTMRALAAEFAKTSPVEVIIVPNLGSSGGIKALSKGAIDVAVFSRPIQPEETKAGITGFEYGRTPFVVITTKERVSGLKDVRELAEIYAGVKSNWADGQPIRLVLRPAQDVDSVLLASFSPEMKAAVQGALARPGMIVAASDQDAVDAIERTPGALGTSTLALIQSETRVARVLALGGVVPTPKSVADGSYPYYRTMYVARKNKSKQSAARFLEFISSSKARQILINSGHWISNPRAGR